MKWLSGLAPRGDWERIFLAATDLLLSLPWLFFLITVRALLQLDLATAVSVTITFLLLGMLGWAGPARVRAAVVSMRRSEFLLQARSSGIAGSRLPWAHLNAALQQITTRQRADGGWAQRDEYPSDAYATGESLYALHQAGTPVTAELYRKGVAFLLKNQYQNGAWFVKSRAYPTQTYFESGYPFGHNQWISAAGANWASLAIAATLPDAKPATSANR